MFRGSLILPNLIEANDTTERVKKGESKQSTDKEAQVTSGDWQLLQAGQDHKLW